MASLMFSEGDKIEVSIKRENKNTKNFTSQVVEIISDSEIIMYCPMLLGKIVVLPVQETYSLTFFTQRNGFIGCDAVVINHFKSEDIYYTKMKIISSFIKVQRREFFRLECIIPCEFGEIDPQTNERRELNKAQIIDIGGGGVKFVTNNRMASGTLVVIIFELGKDKLALESEILRVTDNRNKSAYRYECSSRFEAISNIDREVIVQFIFNEQRKVIKRTR